MTVIRFFTLCPGTYPQQIYSFGVLSFYPPSSASATSGKLLLKHATSIKQYVSFSNHSTIYFHITSDVDRFADYLLLLKKGRQLLYGDIESIRDAYRMVAGERHALRAFGGRLVYMEETPVGCSALVKHDHAEYDRALKVWEPDTEELMYYLAKGAEHGRGNQI